MSDTTQNDLPEGDRGLGDLLGAFLGGGGNAPTGGSEDPLSSLLGGLMGGDGGSAPSANVGAGGGTLDLDAMLGSMGGGQGQAPAGGGGDPLSSLLGGLMGGGGNAPAGGGLDLGGLLGGLMGGSGGGAAAGGLGGLLGGLMGGGGQANAFGGGGGIMLPFAETLSEKLGISPAMANALVGAAMGLIASSLMKQRSGDRAAEGLTMNSLMDPDYLRQSGIVSQVSQETGLDEDETIRGLQEAIGLAGTQGGSPSGGEQPDSGDLKDLLDKW